MAEQYKHADELMICRGRLVERRRFLAAIIANEARSVDSVASEAAELKVVQEQIEAVDRAWTDEKAIEPDTRPLENWIVESV